MSINYRPSYESIVPTTKQPLNTLEIEYFFKHAQYSIENLDKKDVSLYPIDVNTQEIFFIDNIFPKELCDNLCKSVDNCSKLSFWNCDTDENQAKKFRNAETIEMNYALFSNIIWNQIKTVFENFDVKINLIEPENDSDWERELPGLWIPTAVNPDLLFARYPPGGHFAPHTDGRVTADFNNRSFYSIIIFLNDIPLEKGGGTRFYCENTKTLVSEEGNQLWTADKSNIIQEVESVAGRCLIFNQKLLHEGVPTLEMYSKYIIRTDVMFSRTPPVCCNDSDLYAYSLYKKGEYLTEAGLISEGIACMKKAVKSSSKELLSYLGM